MLAHLAACYVTAHESASVAHSQATRVFTKIFNRKLSARPNALTFCQLICECTRINVHNTNYDQKLGVMTPLMLSH